MQQRLLRCRSILAVGGLVLGFGTAQLATAFLQVPDEPSPASGTAQVVAQGVVDIPDGDIRWEITERSAPLPANATESRGELGFLIVDSGVLLAENLGSGEQQRLPQGEAMLALADADQSLVGLGSDPAVYRSLSLVEADAAAPEGDGAQFTSEPFAGPGARHDLDLVRDALGPGGTMTIPAGALPTLVLVLDGVAEVASETGDVFSLGGGEAVALSGPLVVTATENGATLMAAYTGPAVPRLEAGATPVPDLREIEAAGTPTPDAAEALPAETAIATPDATDLADDDDDGLTNAAEDDAGTDPNLADTDEDGLTDGEEIVEIGTSPLSADTDSDGVLDGDEVAQGSNPLDGLAGTPAEEGATVDETPVTEPTPAGVAAVPGDSDGDGLEDVIEIELGTDPADLDTDDDGSTDGDEYYVHQTGTRNPDTDGDGVLDGDEIANGTDPNDPASF
jgi:hypothetical protein